MLCKYSPIAKFSSLCIGMRQAKVHGQDAVSANARAERSELSKKTHHCEPVVSETPLERARFDMISDVILCHSVRVRFVRLTCRFNVSAIVRSATHTHCKIRTSSVSHRAPEANKATGTHSKGTPDRGKVSCQSTKTISFGILARNEWQGMGDFSPMKMQVKATRTF